MILDVLGPPVTIRKTRYVSTNTAASKIHLQGSYDILQSKDMVIIQKATGRVRVWLNLKYRPDPRDV